MIEMKSVLSKPRGYAQLVAITNRGKKLTKGT